jgi:hypothetical protein
MARNVLKITKEENGGKEGGEGSEGGRKNK